MEHHAIGPNSGSLHAFFKMLIQQGPDGFHHGFLGVAIFWNYEKGFVLTPPHWVLGIGQLFLQIVVLLPQPFDVPVFPVDGFVQLPVLGCDLLQEKSTGPRAVIAGEWTVSLLFDEFLEVGDEV